MLLHVGLAHREGVGETPAKSDFLSPQGTITRATPSDLSTQEGSRTS